MYHVPIQQFNAAGIDLFIYQKSPNFNTGVAFSKRDICVYKQFNATGIGFSTADATNYNSIHNYIIITITTN